MPARFRHRHLRTIDRWLPAELLSTLARRAPPADVVDPPRECSRFSSRGCTLVVVASSTRLLLVASKLDAWSCLLALVLLVLVAPRERARVVLAMGREHKPTP